MERSRKKMMRKTRRMRKKKRTRMEMTTKRKRKNKRDQIEEILFASYIFCDFTNHSSN